jgi:CYTH domain-containing protein
MIYTQAMSVEIPKHNPEKKEKLDDNARKFITGTLDPELLDRNGASSFTLTVDWLETGEDNEVKVAHKKFDNGDVQILLIAKITKDGNRTSEKEKVTEDKYQQLKTSSVLHLEKKRYEFEYSQNGTTFSVKYDEFADGKLNMLEVDASNEEERNSFSPDDFPAELEEVTGDVRYYGYRIAEVA